MLPAGGKVFSQRNPYNTKNMRLVLHLHFQHKNMELSKKSHIIQGESPISKCWKVTMLIKEYDKKACGYQFCVKI